MYFLFAIIVFIGSVNFIASSNRHIEENVYFEIQKEINFNDHNTKCAILIDDQIKINELKRKLNNVLDYDALNCDISLKIHDNEINVNVLNNNGKILLITGSDVPDNYLFSTTLETILKKNIKLFVISYIKSSDETVLNLKKIALMTQGYYFNIYENPEKLTHDIVRNEEVIGVYKRTFQVFAFTRHVFIRILGSLENIENIEVMTSGKIINLLDQQTVTIGNVYFVTLKVNQSGPWTISMYAKKRVFIDIISENAYQQIENKVQSSKLIASERLAQALPVVSIDIGSSTELLTSPNKYIQIYFDVTNNQDETLTAKFECIDTKYIIQQYSPRSATIEPNQMTVITVSVYTTISPGSLDTITCSIDGITNAKKVAYLYVNSEKPVDNERPTVRYKSTNCSDIEPEDCQTKTWSIEVVAQDSGTGLLQFTSEPRGIYFNGDNFISGTTDEVTAYYEASCCNPKLQITATDLSGNKQSIQIDVSIETTTMSTGVITAIVLGVILVIVAIIVIVYFVIRQKQKASLDLPTYRGPSSSRTPL